MIHIQTGLSGAICLASFSGDCWLLVRASVGQVSSSQPPRAGQGQELRLDVPTKLQAICDRTSLHGKQVESTSKKNKDMSDADMEALRRETQMGHRRSDDEHFSTFGAASRALCPGITGHSPFNAALPFFSAGQIGARMRASAAAAGLSEVVGIGQDGVRWMCRQEVVRSWYQKSATKRL